MRLVGHAATFWYDAVAGAEVQAELTALLAALQPAIDRGASSSSSSNSSAAWTSSSQAAAPLSLRQRLEEAHAVLRDKVLPYASLGAEAWQQAGAGPEAVLAPVPLGFDTGGEGLGLTS